MYDTCASISVMSHHFFNKLENKPKLIKCNRTISGAGRGILNPVGECFVQFQVWNTIFRDRVVVIENLTRNYILGPVLHRTKQYGTGYSRNGRHYITLNGEILAPNYSQIVTKPMLKTKGKIKLIPSSISVIEVRTPGIPDSNNIYEVDFNTFQLLEGIIPLDIMHHVDQKIPRTLKVPILNTNNTISSLAKNSPIVTLVPAGKCEQIQEIKWLVLNDAK